MRIIFIYNLSMWMTALVLPIGLVLVALAARWACRR